MTDDLAIGLKARTLLDESADRLPAHIQLKLSQAVQAALVVQKTENLAISRPTWAAGRSAPTSTWMDRWFGWLNQPVVSMAVSATFMLGAAYGIVTETQNFEDRQLGEYAELDSAILTDDLPTEAFLDSGFVNFSGEKQRQNYLQLDAAPAPDNVGSGDSPAI